MCRSTSSTSPPRRACERGGRVHGQRRRPDAALGADERDDAPKLFGHGVDEHPPHRLIERLRRDRILEALGHTGPHRLEHHVRIERGGDEHDAGAADSACGTIARPGGNWRSPRMSTTSAAGEDRPARRGRQTLERRRDPTFSPADRRASSSCTSLLRTAT